MIHIREKDIQNDIRISLNDIAIVFRANVGMFFTKDGIPINVGLPKGYFDLSGFRKSDGKALYIEVKNEKGRVSKEQQQFYDTLRKYPIIIGICRSAEEARELVLNG